MRSLRDLEPGQELECFGTRDSQEADVFLLGERVGILTGTPEGFESADGSWTVETRVQGGRPWWRSSRYTLIVTERARNAEVVHHEEIGWSLGSLWGLGAQSPFVFAGGHAYIFGFIGRGFLKTTYVFQRKGTRVLTFTLPQWWRGGNKIRLVVTVGRDARGAEDDLPILVLLGCRMMLAAVS